MQTIRFNHAGGRLRESGVRGRLSAVLGSLLLVAAALAAGSAMAGTLEQVQASGQIRVGYLANAKPLSFKTGGQPDGYAIALCEKVINAVKAELALPALRVSWQPVNLENRAALLQAGELDLLCTPMAESLARRGEMAFSIPVFPSGVRAVLRADAARALRAAIAGTPVEKPLWRGSPAARLLDKKRFVVVKGSTSEGWLAQNLLTLQIDADIIPVADYRAGLDSVLSGQADVFFGDRAVVLGTLSEAEHLKLDISDRLLTHEPLSLGMARGDEDFRLLVDTVLSETYRSDQFPALFSKWFGSYGEQAQTFFMWNAIEP